jgi:uncharacterized protein YigE (DUF2233 family)
MIGPLLRSWFMLLLPALIALSFLSVRPAEDPRFASRVVDPAKEQVTFHWKDEHGQGKVLGNIGALDQEVKRMGRKLVFAMNGGMYDPQQAPVGLYVEEGRVLHKLNTTKGGSGNFHMQPNGVFGITKEGKAFVHTTAECPATGTLRYATQSGPMLLVKGVINAQFKQGSANLNIRNGVGILPDGRAIFAISREPVNFFDFASWFKAQGCTDALYLDGAISRAYIPEAGVDQRDGQLGVLIAVVQ